MAGDALTHRVVRTLGDPGTRRPRDPAGAGARAATSPPPAGFRPETSVPRWRVSPALVTVLFFVVGLALVLPTGPLAAQEIPAAPDDGRALLHDGARVLGASDRVVLEAILEEVLEVHDTPFVVVTVRSMSEYGPPAGMEVEAFARAWFDQWGIGAQVDSRGILLLVSRDDRVARLELGEGWGRGWDGHAEEIMDQVIVPRLAADAWGEALTQGGWAILEMAEAGPSGEVPAIGGAAQVGGGAAGGAGEAGASPTDLPFDLGELVPPNPVPGWVRVLLALAGIAAVVAGLRSDAARKDLLCLGAVLLLGALSVWLLLLGLFTGARWWLGWHHDPHGHRGGGGGGGSGGGLGGGRSGGGGATGRF